MESIWEKSAPRMDFDTLDGNKNTDVLIIGGGIAGILCAHKLKQKGVDCILIEKDRILGGVTSKTTAKITFCHGLIYDKLIREFGKKKAMIYLNAQREALCEYEKLCKNIDCDYEKKTSYVYSNDNSKKIRKEITAMRSLGVNAVFSAAHSLPIPVAGAIAVEDQAQFNPLKFLLSIAWNLPIYEKTKALEFLPNKVKTNRGEVSFKKLIVATHFPIYNKHGSYFLKMYQHRSYVLALKGAKNVSGMYVDESDTGLSFRNYGDLLLLGGGGHRTGKQGGSWQELEKFAAEHYKNAKIIDRWATQDCMTLDKVPYIGQYSKSTPNVYVATGFNKWGISNSMVAANILCDLICGKVNPYTEVFSPSRTILRPKLAVNAFESIIGLITPTAPRCPHLGCALKYNKAEHTWDCPCHGSRFTEDGKVINGPATGNKSL